jgi:hypothetical protein
MPTLACYETATFNGTTCVWDVTGTQPAQPTLACYETASFNTTTCSWDVTGTQPAMPTLACYQTATFNGTTCQWDVTGTQPAQPGSLASPFDISSLPGYGVATSAMFNFNAAGAWAGWSVPAGKVVLGAKIISAGDNFSNFAVFRPASPGEAFPHYTYGANEYGWVMQAKAGQSNNGVQIEVYYADPLSNYTITQSSQLNYNGAGAYGGWSAPTGDIASGGGYQFNNSYSSASVSALAVANSTWPHYTFGSNEQGWVVAGPNNSLPNPGRVYVISFDSPINCWDNFVFNTTTCAWDNTGSQPAQPALACYETATFNTTSCAWDVTGTQPAQPPVVNCWDNFVFNATTCVWDNTGTQPAQPPVVNCWDNFVFNTTSCQWDNTGSPNPPIVTTISACESYNWAITGLNYTATGVYTVNIGCQDYTLNLTINPLPTVTASDVSACAGNSVSLIGNPSGGTFSVANPYSGPTTTYTYTYTDGNGCTNTSAPANIFTTAAPPVTGINMSNIGGNSATVNWNGIPGLIWYEIRYRAVGAGSWTGGGTQAAPTTFKNIVGLTAGTQYEVEVRGFCSTPNFPGPWSATSNFTTSNSCVAPMNLNAINITGTTTTLTWTAIPNTNYYQIRYRLAAGPGAWVNGTASGTATSKNYTGLTLNTNYEWQIRAICNPSPFTTGPWSEISDWTTLASKPSVTEEVSLQEEIMVYPNPATSVVMVDITATNAQQTVVKLFDISGRLVKQMQARHEAGSHTMTIGLDEISSGMYTVQVYCNDALKHTSKISKQD